MTTTPRAPAPVCPVRPAFRPAPLLAIAAMLLAAATLAQGPGGEGRRGGRGQEGMARMVPVLGALDADRDGRLSAAEVTAAPAALKTMDRNGDGRLGRDELQPPRPGGRGPGGGPGGGPGMGMLPPIPLMTALDADGDQELSAAEIAGAGDALRTLDKNGDSVLDGAEMLPAFPGGGPGGGPGGFGGPTGPRVQPEDMDPQDGRARVPDLATFQELAYQGSEVMIDTPLTGLQFVKFVVADVGTEKPTIYFMNTKRHRAHPMFVRVVGLPFGRGRGGQGGGVPGQGTNMMGVLVYRPLLQAPDGSTGLFTFEFEPNDSYPLTMIQVAFDLLRERAPVVKGRLAAHILDGTRRVYEQEREAYRQAGVPVLLPEELFRGIAFLPLNRAVGFGRLRLLEVSERPGSRDIAVYRTLPNEMPRVAGVITAVQQTPLSHVNLRAVQDGVPNAFVRGADADPAIQALLGRYVRYEVRADGFDLRAATDAEVDAHFAALRPKAPRTPLRNLGVTAARPLGEIAFTDSSAFGVKVANLAAMRGMDLPPGMVPDGYGLPFACYDAFMTHNGLYDAARTMLAQKDFAEDASVREKALAAFRRKVRKGEFPPAVAATLAAVQRAFPAGTPLRCRSSTNAEDLEGFSGAGLYDSFTHRPDEGDIARTIAQVYASLWNFRAFEEREFHRIDHLQTAMGVLIHPNYDGELANGVAVTDDIVYQTNDQQFGRRYYVSVQLGEELVTNPQGDAIPEETLLHPTSARRDTLVRTSNRVGPDEALLGARHLQDLRTALRTLEREFRSLYGKQAGDRFAIEVEFKLDAANRLVIKQARPWVYGG